MTCSLHMSLLFDLLIKLLSEMMILFSALMNHRKKVDFDLCERRNFDFWFLTCYSVICEAIESNEGSF